MINKIEEAYHEQKKKIRLTAIAAITLMMALTVSNALAVTYSSSCSIYRGTYDVDGKAKPLEAGDITGYVQSYSTSAGSGVLHGCIVTKGSTFSMERGDKTVSPGREATISWHSPYTSGTFWSSMTANAANHDGYCRVTLE